MDCATIPATFPVGAAINHNEGFRPSDAALIQAGQHSSESRSNLRETSDGVKDNLVQTLETKFQLERSSKENAVRVETSARVSDAAMQDIRRELVETVREESQRTRELLHTQNTARMATELADAKSARASSDLLAAIKLLLGK